MIKFFRKTRQNMIKENRASKYLLYAIGEIVLVVIGILIALSINNWNEEKNNQQELHDYILKIANNINEDINQANEFIVKRKKLREHNRKAIKTIKRKEFDVGILKKAENFFYEYYFTPNTSGYEALKSSGYIGKLKDPKLDSLTNRYYYLINKIYEIESSYNNFIEDMERDIKSKYSMIKYKELLNNRFNDSLKETNYTEYEDVREELIPFFSSPAFEVCVIRTSTQTFFYKELIDTGEAFINMAKYYKND